MSIYGGQRQLVVDCCYCQTQIQLPSVNPIYLDGTSVRCGRCYASTRVASPGSTRSLHGAVAYYVDVLFSGCTIVSGNKVSGNTGDHNGSFSVGNTLPPSPYNHAPPGPPPNMHGRKKAVICGISYKYSRHELKGCINDAKCMRHLLINKFKFPDYSILMLTEEETQPAKIPNRYNIRMALHWLVQGCQPGDSLVFHYSGHGSRQRDYHGDEVDGYDETLCPLDFETQGMIVDDEINATIVRPIPHGVKLHAIIDSGHSGTVLDLPFLCRMNRGGKYVWEDHRPGSGIWKGTSGGEVISISGCDDDQTSADTSALSKITSTSAMTFCFIQAIERGQAATYGSILNSMRNIIRSTGSGGGGLRQEPQLTSCEPFDVYTKPFAL
ncbi:putative Caspase-like domain-containing protein [Rosa chinensis]|uniref:Putative Caspase-like domain-containing protein n=1 Tax=Rosa chinensis TaxID=74649 RepID=A0A2P6SEN6_ROSCH|nr:metacaspase-1 [Rosa chinensis]PRQ57131.1 putative Caspase-like domain-containing protein [Rosa chinensis]